MMLKVGRLYQSEITGVIYRVKRIDTYTRNVELHSRSLVFPLYLDLDCANKTLKPLSKLKEILIEYENSEK